MINILTKWMINITFEDNGYPTTIFISDNFYENVLRKLAEIEFPKDVVHLEIVKENEEMTGYIKTIVLDKGYGFIKGSDSVEYFFHKDDYNGDWNVLVEADTLRKVSVTFEISPLITRGPRAANVTLL